MQETRDQPKEKSKAFPGERWRETLEGSQTSRERSLPCPPLRYTPFARQGALPEQGSDLQEERATRSRTRGPSIPERGRRNFKDDNKRKSQDNDWPAGLKKSKSRLKENEDRQEGQPQGKTWKRKITSYDWPYRPVCCVWFVNTVQRLTSRHDCKENEANQNNTAIINFGGKQNPKNQKENNSTNHKARMRIIFRRKAWVIL